MSDTLSATTGLPFDPEHPPTRIYVSGFTYKIVEPRLPRPPVPHTVKCVLKWTGPDSKIANNIFYILCGTGADTTIPTFLTGIGDAVMTAIAASTLFNGVASVWSLSSCTVHDNTGLSSSVGISTHAPIPGLSSAAPLPPQVAVCISWAIGASYRGGKPRWYIPGVPGTAVTTPGGSTMAGTYAANLETVAEFVRANVNSSTVSGFSLSLGTISYQTGHAARPTPLFRPFTGSRVHERLDSQRRRNGKESAVGSVP